MADRSRGVARMPRDVQARERLRRAQDAEARAVSAVYSAQDAVATAARKRERALAAADAVVAEAERSLAVAQSGLVDVSGLGRAGTLLGLDRATLRKARSTALETRAGGEAA